MIFVLIFMIIMFDFYINYIFKLNKSNHVLLLLDQVQHHLVLPQQEILVLKLLVLKLLQL